MKQPSSFKAAEEIINAVQSVVIIQADNPDGDSLATSLALEEILGNAGKQTHLYCGVDIPEHLRYIAGWDRVSRELPKQFDASIIVDTSSDTLLEQLTLTNQKMWLRSRPCIIIDHHPVKNSIDFATVVINQPSVASGEVLYELAKALKWNVSHHAATCIAIAILTDSLGLMSEGTSARSIHIIAELVEQGVKLADLENARRAMMKRPAELIHYKGRLLERVEFYNDEQIAMVTIPWDEIEKYSHLYNPSMLVMDDMRLAINTRVAIAFKRYPDGKVTAKIRCNYGTAIAGKLAEHFGGGGHTYASGFKITNGTPYEEVKRECVAVATRLLAETPQAESILV